MAVEVKTASELLAALAAPPGDGLIDVPIEDVQVIDLDGGSANVGTGGTVHLRGTKNGSEITAQQVRDGQTRPAIRTENNFLFVPNWNSGGSFAGLELEADWRYGGAGPTLSRYGAHGTLSYFPTDQNRPVGLNIDHRNLLIRFGPMHVAGVQQNNGANRLSFEDIECTGARDGTPGGAWAASGPSALSNFGPVIQSGGAANNWFKVKRWVGHNILQYAASNAIQQAKITDGNNIIAETANNGSEVFRFYIEDVLGYDLGGDMFNMFKWGSGHAAASGAGEVHIANCTSYRVGLAAGLTIPHPSFTFNQSLNGGNGGYDFNGWQITPPSAPAFTGTQAAFAAGYLAGGTDFYLSNNLAIRDAVGALYAFNSLGGGSNGLLHASNNVVLGYGDTGLGITAKTGADIDLADIGGRDFTPSDTSDLNNAGIATFQGVATSDADRNGRLWGGFGPGVGSEAPVSVSTGTTGGFTFTSPGVYDYEIVSTDLPGVAAGPLSGGKINTSTLGAGPYTATVKGIDDCGNEDTFVVTITPEVCP